MYWSVWCVLCIFPEMTYNVFSGTLNPSQSINRCLVQSRSTWRPCSVSRCRAIGRARTCGRRAWSITRSCAVVSVNRPRRGSPMDRNRTCSTCATGSTLISYNTGTHRCTHTDAHTQVHQFNGCFKLNTPSSLRYLLLPASVLLLLIYRSNVPCVAS